MAASLTPLANVVDNLAGVRRFQRSCTAFDSAIEHFGRVRQALPTVLKGLRAATPQLSPSCIAQPRVLPDGI